MRKIKKFLKVLFFMAFGVYILLFLVFFFDLDGKLLFYGVEPWLDKHFDRIKRRDPLKVKYSMDKPNYEYATK